MTFPDDNRDEPAKGTPDEHTGPELPLDEDAAWRAIVENYGARPELGPDSPDAPDSSPAPVAEAPGPAVFDRSYLNSVEAEAAGDRARESWAEEGHFEPPEPPPVPRSTPARRLAWAGLFGGPALMLVAVIAHVVFPTWLSMMLVAGFVGGFIFLVATMERTGRDGSGGDDGAVV
jgi:hypothetical protein